MCRSEMSAVIAWLISKCLWSGCKWQRRVKKLASLLPCDLWMCKKENPEKIKKKQQKNLKDPRNNLDYNAYSVCTWLCAEAFLNFILIFLSNLILCYNFWEIIHFLRNKQGIIHLVFKETFRKTYISDFLMRLCTCTYQGVKNVSFS